MPLPNQQQYKSPWYILGLNSNASKSDIMTTFRKLSLLLHPDHHQKEGKAKIDWCSYEFSLIAEARDKLLKRGKDWQRVAVKTGWRRPSAVDEYHRGVGKGGGNGKFLVYERCVKSFMLLQY